MGSDVVVVMAPEGELAPRVGQVLEHLLVQQLVPQPAIEGLDEGVLRWLAGLDVVPFNTGRVLRFQYDPGG